MNAATSQHEPQESFGMAAQFDPQAMYEDLLRSGTDWAEKDAAAAILEETKKSLLSKLKMQSQEKSDAARETEALASDAYEQHLNDMVEARRLATLARVEYDATKVLAELTRTQQSNMRAELGLVRQGAVG